MEILIGKVKHFYGHIPAIVVELNDNLKVGDKISIRKKNNEERFSQVVESMEINRKKIQEAKKGEEVSILVINKAKVDDFVYKI